MWHKPRKYQNSLLFFVREYTSHEWIPSQRASDVQSIRYHDAHMGFNEQYRLTFHSQKAPHNSHWMVNIEYVYFEIKEKTDHVDAGQTL